MVYGGFSGVGGWGGQRHPRSITHNLQLHFSTTHCSRDISGQTETWVLMGILPCISSIGIKCAPAHLHTAPCISGKGYCEMKTAMNMVSQGEAKMKF